VSRLQRREPRGRRAPRHLKVPKHRSGGHRRARARRSAVIAAVPALAIGGLATGAYAYWSAGGAGAATASTRTMLPVTVSAFVAGDSPTSKLRPNGPAADVILRVTNPNPFPVTLVSVQPNGTITGSGGSGTCATTGVTFIPPVSPSVAIGAATSLLVGLPAAATMSASSDAGCAGALFRIPVSVQVHA